MMYLTVQLEVDYTGTRDKHITRKNLPNAIDVKDHVIYMDKTREDDKKRAKKFNLF